MTHRRLLQRDAGRIAKESADGAGIVEREPHRNVSRRGLHGAGPCSDPVRRRSVRNSLTLEVLDRGDGRRKKSRRRSVGDPHPDFIRLVAGAVGQHDHADALCRQQGQRRLHAHVVAGADEPALAAADIHAGPAERDMSAGRAAYFIVHALNGFIRERYISACKRRVQLGRCILQHVANARLHLPRTPRQRINRLKPGAIAGVARRGRRGSADRTFVHA